MLLVHGVGGPPLEYALPKVAAHAEVHVLALTPLPGARRGLWRPLCASVVESPRTGAAGDGPELVELIERRAREVGADAVLTLSEFAVVAVALACEALGLAGAGPNVVAARDKREMRRVWQRAGVPVPGFAPVLDEHGIEEAFGFLRPPLLLKSAWGAGSTGQVTVTTPDEAVQAWRDTSALMRATANEGYGELHVAGTHGDFLLEELVTGSAEGWFTEPGWGDYVSVEGIVADGVHHPLCISGRLPTVPPFTERGSVTPVALPAELQHRIEDVVRIAVDALGLDTCATHTEIKLGADGQMWAIETAARFGGVLITRQAEDAHGLDMIGMLVRQLLRRPVEYPSRMLTEGRGAAASFVVLPVDEAGNTWRRDVLWDFTRVDWRSLLSPDSVIQLVPELSHANGTPVTPYASGEGGLSRAAVCFVNGPDASTVVEDCRRIVKALPAALPPVPRQGVDGEGLLDLDLFAELAGTLAGQPYVKVVVDRELDGWHILDHAEHTFHAHYIADRILGMDRKTLYNGIDTFNHSVYEDPDRRFLLGVLSLHHLQPDGDDDTSQPFMVLETVEVDTMGAALLAEFHGTVRARLDPRLPLLLKPANHIQEAAVDEMPEGQRLPCIAAHELYGTAEFTALNPGEAHGRLRHFVHAEDYRLAQERGDIAWYDILALPVVPDDIPRVAGLISTRPTTPLSHTNVLAAGWGIPNAVVRELTAHLSPVDGDLDGTWVRYAVTADGIVLEPAEKPVGLDALTHPERRVRTVAVGTPRTESLPVLPLSGLLADDRHAYGTKAANLGELLHVLRCGSPDLSGFYAVPRPPRPDLLGRLAERLDAPRDATAGQLAEHAALFLRDTLSVPEGIAIPFAVQQEFLAAAPAVQQRIGMLKMALKLGSEDETDALCAELQDLVRATALPDRVLDEVMAQLVRHVPDAGSLVVRSSSNAEDLPGFSAAGLYESVAHVTGPRHLAAAVKQVWASLFTARAVRLRHQAGIPLEDTYMGVIVQRRQTAAYGGVMVTCDPTRRDDFRTVSVNCAAGSAEAVVAGAAPPIQYLFNTVEGGGRTLSLGDAAEDLPTPARERLAQLAFAGRLLQGHFGGPPEYATPLDIEWLLDPEGRLRVVQVRPYAV
ncbi:MULTISPECIES: PEP/pyruvate-binding domain-containing protein [Streptomyces]|uniref:PEP/pyruvate-binding domain-containing protein n=1 Tax=Streptomyces TaxID=1883 RepID=UPI001F2F813F|nr:MULTISPECIES: PEP/pyruvate-binding domain-containing protein [Streptomyces]